MNCGGAVGRKAFYVRSGLKVLEDWLSSEGRRRLEKIKRCLDAATPRRELVSSPGSRPPAGDCSSAPAAGSSAAATAHRQAFEPQEGV